MRSADDVSVEFLGQKATYSKHQIHFSHIVLSVAKDKGL